MALGAVIALAGCEGESDEPAPPSGNAPRIYLSAPMQEPRGRAFVAGARLALAQEPRRAAGRQVEYVPLDSAPENDGPSPEAVDANAERAADDPAAIAYIGELDSVTAAVSLPVLNDAGLAQVGPASLPAGLTRAAALTGAGEPDRHYPTGFRHFVRSVPSEQVEAAGIAALMRARGCRSVFALTTLGGASGARLRQVAAAAESAGIEVADRAVLPADPDAASELADDLVEAGAPCAALAGVSARELARGRRTLPDALLEMRLFGGERLADPVGAALQAVPAEAVTGAGRAPSALAGRFAAFVERYRARHGALPGPWALYGYEAMSLVLDAIRRAGGPGSDRAAVVDALFATEGRRSVLGTYSVDRFGDSTLRVLGVWRVGRSGPVFRERIDVSSVRQSQPARQR